MAFSPDAKVGDCFLGIDLGTSALKAVVADARDTACATATVPLAIAHPGPRASEQAPQDWWAALESAFAHLAAQAPEAMGRVRAVGLAGQMHATVLLDAAGRPVRPAMLWNDGRAHAEAAELAALGDELAAECGVPCTANFSAPKLLWLRRHDPVSLDTARTLLLPKDYLRLCLTGERATDPSDGAGTWLLDEAARTWSDRAVAACGLDRALLPPVLEASATAGWLRADVAARFGLPPGIPVATGGGDTMVGAVGAGVTEPGTALVGMGTSAQLFAATDRHQPFPQRMVHAYCHAVPGRWCQMAAMLNGSGVLAQFPGLLAGTDVAGLLDRVAERFTGPSPLLVLPYLSGERTPHNDPHARGVVFGLAPDTTPEHLAQAAMEGVAFTFADAAEALAGADTTLGAVWMVGGAARSVLWARMIAAVLGREIRLAPTLARGPAFGAARLARLALREEAPSDILRAPEVFESIAPDPRLSDAYAPRIEMFRALYQVTRPLFPALDAA